MMKKLLWVVLCGALVVQSGQAAGPATGHTALQLVGQGQYSYLFWDLYQAVLYSPDGRFSGYEQSRPLKLELTYQRDIQVEDFVDATLQQWKKQHGELTPLKKRWAGELRQIWRNVKKGDRLACIYTSAGSTEFLLNDQPLGTVVDPQFGPMFLDIWLGAGTTEPALRDRLLGKS